MSTPSPHHPRYWLSWVAVFLIRILALLPLPLLWVLGTLLGYLGYFLVGSRRRVAARNIALCFPDHPPAKVKQLVRRHFLLLGRALLTSSLSLGVSRRRLLRVVRFRDRRYLDQALEAGRGVILLAPHFLGLELGGVAISATLRKPGVFMYQKIRNPVIDLVVRRGRTQFGTATVERQGDLRSLVRFIRSGQPFYYLPDQDPGPRRGIFVPFCGVPAATVPALGRFAKLTGALVIPCFTRLLPWGRGLEVIFQRPLEGFPTGDPVADTTAMNRIIEEGVRMMPEQYFWVHRRFKTRPPGETSLYT